MKLTVPQRRALAAIEHARRHNLTARVSNETRVADDGVRVYWQTADNLAAKQLVLVDQRPGGEGITLTAEGIEEASR